MKTEKNIVGNLQEFKEKKPMENGVKTDLSDVEVKVFNMDARAMLDLSYGSVVFDGSVEAYYFIMDVMAYTSDVKRIASNVKEGRHTLRRRGVGFRIMIGAAGMEIDGALDIKKIAAAAEFGLVTCKVNIEIEGLSNIDLNKMPIIAHIQQNSLNAEFYRKLGESMEYLVDYIVEAEDEDIDIQDIDIVELGLPDHDEKNIARSYIYSLWQIYYGHSLSRSIHDLTQNDDLRIKVIPGKVAEVYESMGVVMNPNEFQKRQAIYLLQMGRG